jgi:hypothetical protein
VCQIIAIVRRLAILVPLVVSLVTVSAVSGQPGSGWSTFRDGLVELSHPAGWQVQRDGGTGRLVIQGMRNERLIVWPFFVGSQLDAATAGQVLGRMASAQAPKLTWTPAQPVGHSALRMEGRGGADAAVASLAWTPSVKGTAAQFVLAGAPGERRRETEEAFAKVLASVRLTGRRDSGGGGGPARPGVGFVPFRDPSEGAFTLEVPQGWRVSGGLVRKASVDVRSGVVASSPDNQVHVRLGDVELPTFSIPTPMMLQLGFREGSPYSPGYGVTMIVMRYLPGEQFARYWVTARVGPVCGGIQLVSSQPLPQTVQAMNAIMVRNGSPVMSQRLHAGDAAFRCQQNQAPAVGYLFVATLLTAGNDGGGIWNVDQLHGYLSPPDRAGQAQAILAHMLASIRLNPEWVRMQQNITASTSRIVADTSAHISKVVSDSYWSRQASQAEISRKRSNQILGVEDVRDPATGRELKVESGSNYYWIDPRGNIVGTDIDNRPTLDFRELVRLP